MTPLETVVDGTQSEFTKMLPIILYYHGGDFVVLCPNQNLYDKFCHDLARTYTAVVMSIH